MTGKTVTTNNQQRQWSYNYSYTNNNFDSLLIEKTETDPNALKTSTDYYNFDTTLFYKIQEGSSYGAYESDPRRYYKTGIITQEREIDNSNNVLLKKTYDYIFDTSDSRGFYGQLVSEKIYNAPSFNMDLETKYGYYKWDTTGKYLYGATGIPYCEGNLRTVIKPNNEEEKYFYHAISHSEEIEPGGDQRPHPQVGYKIKFNDGAIQIINEDFNDQRMPIRIDNYKITGTYTVDTLKRVYFQYNVAGAPTKIINENRYLTELVYEPVHRISSITLPGDFSHDQSYDSPQYVHNQYYTTSIIYPIGIGSMDMNNNVIFDKTLPNENENLFCGDFFSLKYNNVGQNLKQAAFFKFDFNLSQFVTIDTAKFTIWPMGYSTIGSGCNFSTRVDALDDVSGDSPQSGCGYAGWRVHNGTLAGVWQETQVQTGDVYCDQYHMHVFDMKTMLDDMIVASKPLKGLIISPTISCEGGIGDNAGDYQVGMTFVKSDCFSWPTWNSNYCPLLTIIGTYDDVDTIHVQVTLGGTYVYEYDDSHKTVLVKSRQSHGPNYFKRVKYSLDGFGNIKEKDIIKDYLDVNPTYNTYGYTFNYMNKPANNTDARTNVTKLSYDIAGRLSQTFNADDSSSYVSYSYSSSLSHYFGVSYSGFIENQTLQDESHKTFNKYFDAVGNLLREQKYVAGDGNGNIQINDNPYDPDTTYSGQDIPGETISLTTDYKYDKLYRLIEVKTPENKHIYYTYDAFGRQSKRKTPDAGTVSMVYDGNNNLIYSQDSVQYALDTHLNTYRNYDALNRLNVIGLLKLPSGSGVGEDNFFSDSINAQPDVVGSADSVLIVNVYDTLLNPVVSLFSSPPSDYTGANFTKGNLVATAYRTNLGDAWNYKYYRYDERGRVVKMWTYIDGLGWKIMYYGYNSQNQATGFTYESGQSDMKGYSYTYDAVGRLAEVYYYIGSEEIPPPIGDYPTAWLDFIRYTYNANSQLDTVKFNNNGTRYNYRYSNRNWVTWFNKTGGSAELFYYLTYNGNGTIRRSTYSGKYEQNMTNTANIFTLYTYDNSNRLLKADYNPDSNVPDSTYDLVNGYDGDGNLKLLKRHDAQMNIADNFNYDYYTGTNKVDNLTGGRGNVQYTYDLNGNVTGDSLNHLYGMKYDYRNLLTEFRRYGLISSDKGPVPTAFLIKYLYDEAGNRIRKKVLQWVPHDPNSTNFGVDWLSTNEDGTITDTVYTGDNPGGGNLGDNPGTWNLQSIEYYVRDVSGKEIAVYSDVGSGANIEQWNVFGLDNAGKLDANNHKYFYLKDHLGNVRATIDSTSTIVSAQDYDAWGYALDSRTYDDFTTIQKYKFTSKERDKESGLNGADGYDYFGARYYNSRIANWTSVDPLQEKHFDYSPYNYVLRNPIFYIDPDGNQVAFSKYFVTWKDAGGGSIGLGIGTALNKLIEWTFEYAPDVYAAYKWLSWLDEELRNRYAAEIEWNSGKAIGEVNVFANEINIPDEDKIPNELLNPPEKRGWAPTSKATGEKVHIHHVDQKAGGPYIEMFETDHIGKGNKNKNHDPKKKSERESNWSHMVKKYWESEWDSGRFKK